VWLLVVAAVGLFAPIPSALDRPPLSFYQDLVHIPLFALVFFALQVEMQARFAVRPRTVLVTTILLAGAVEILQQFTTRDPSWTDFVLGSAGAGLAWTASALRPYTPARFALVAAMIALVVAAALANVRRELLREERLSARFPVLGEFSDEDEFSRWQAKGGTDIRLVGPNQGHAAGALEIGTVPNADGPGVSTEGFPADWSSYRWLEWTADVPGQRPLPLTVRVDDDLGERFGLRYTTVVNLEPGRHVYRIDLRNAAASLAHPLNLQSIGELHFFLDSPRERHIFMLTGVRLVAERG